MNAALQTLFYTFETDLLPWPEAQQKVLFLNAQYHDGLSRFSPNSIVLQQYFKPYAAGLEARGYEVVSTLSFEDESFDAVFICLPKNKVEACFWIASALRALKPGGLLVCAAENKAGGARIQSMIQGFGLEGLESVSKHKARAVWVRKESVDDTAIEKALVQGGEQKILGGDFVSQPGVFGWDKIDKGSSLLLENIPQDLKGVGADFGCGYGLLTRHVVQHCLSVKQFYAVDADMRAVKCTFQNTPSSSLHGLSVQSTDGEMDHTHKACDDGVVLQGIWADLTQAQSIPKGLDFIVMNPPFHEGKKTDSDIGAAFISSAHECLKRNGILWMVANNQLPYEEFLQQKFFEVHKIFEGQGFKVYKAVK